MLSQITRNQLRSAVVRTNARRALSSSQHPFTSTKSNCQAHAVPVEADVSQPKDELDFTNTKAIFESKSMPELIRAYAVFRICGIEPLVARSGQLVELSNKILGKSLTNLALKDTFFGHFCGGEDAQDIQPTIAKLRESGIGAILDYAAEADVEQPRDLNGVAQTDIQARTYGYHGEEECDANAKIALQSIYDAAGSKDGFTAIKCTAMGKPELLMRMSTVLVDAMDLFMSLEGPNLDRSQKRGLRDHVIDFQTLKDGFLNAHVDLPESEIHEIFDSMDVNKDGKVDFLDWVSYISPMDLTMGPLSQFSNVDQLSEDEIMQMKNMITRLEMLAAAAAEQGVKLMIDAEQTYMQTAIDHLVLNLQRKYNKENPTIFNTYQCYLKDSHARLTVDLERAKVEDYKFAAKLVRGAYMVQERKRALDHGYADPIQPSIEATHDNYNSCVELLLKNNDRASFMVASHNETSTKLTASMMEELGIPKEGGGVYFGQLLGMCDQISYALGGDGYQVYKYVPYGPVDEVLPYLIRRAEENSGLMSGASTELKLLGSEIRRRVLRQ